MSGARVESIEAIKAFKIQLLKFSEATNVALGDAESELHRTMMWLELEAVAYWQGQIRKRTELLGRAQEALRQKQIFKDSTGRQQSAVDEMKAVQLARRRLEIANEKLALVKQYTRRLQKEIEIYKGSVQRFATTAASEIPSVAAKLERMVTTLDAYTNLTPADVGSVGAEMFTTEMTRTAAAAAGFAGPEPAPASKPDDYSALRSRTPDQSAREQAGPAFLTTAGWKIRSLGQMDREKLANLPLERLPCDASERVIVAQYAVECPTIYLHRVDGRGAGDCQWYLGPAEGESQGPINAVLVQDFLAVRPDLKEILTLAKGTLVVLSASGVLAVLNDRNENVWDAST